MHRRLVGFALTKHQLRKARNSAIPLSLCMHSRDKFTYSFGKNRRCLKSSCDSSVARRVELQYGHQNAFSPPLLNLISISSTRSVSQTLHPLSNVHIVSTPQRTPTLLLLRFPPASFLSRLNILLFLLHPARFPPLSLTQLFFSLPSSFSPRLNDRIYFLCVTSVDHVEARWKCIGEVSRDETL